MLRWYWRRWRAAHYEWAAWVECRRWPSPANERALEVASLHLRQVEAGRP